MPPLSAEPNHPHVSSYFETKQPLCMLAPMEGITNEHFRNHLCSLGSVDVAATEFIRITNAKQKLAQIPVHSVPLQVQFMASHPETLGDCIQYAKEKGVLTDKTWIDLNVGCPSKRVNAHGAGAALLCTPKKLVEMIRQVRVVHSGTLSIKTRIGYQSDEQYPEILSALSDCELDFITIHARTKKDSYNAPINLTSLKTAVAALPYPVIGNGDIWSAHDALYMIKETGVSGVMCGRGAVSNPFLFCAIKQSLYPQNDYAPATKNDLIVFILKLIRQYMRVEKSSGKRLIGVAKECCVWLSKNSLLGKEFFQEVKRKQSLHEIEEYLMSLTRDSISTHSNKANGENYEESTQCWSM